MNNGSSHTNGHGLKEADQGVRDLVESVVSVSRASEDVHNRSGSRCGPKVVEFAQPAELMATFCGGDMAIGENGTDDWEKILTETVRMSVKTDHPHFYNALFHGTDFYGKVGGLLCEAMNTNAYTYEVAPVFSIVERELIAYAVRKFGWISGDGLTCPGGSVANMYGLVLARHRKFPQLKRTGTFGCPPLVVYTSVESHYSVDKGANWLGIGLDNVVKIPTDSRGRMLADELERAVARTVREGKIPLAINATLGSTVVGGFDDLRAIHEVARKHDVWLHADAAWGGAYVFSPSLKAEYMPDTRLCDSIAWNPHKMIGAPLQGSIFVCSDEAGGANLLKDANCAAAAYLFQQDKIYDVGFDSGDKAIQCGRKPDAFKIWFMLKVRGEEHVRRTVEQAHDMSRLMAERIKAHENFELVLEPSCTNINFVYVPPRLKRERPFTVEEAGDEEWKDEVSRVVAQIKGRMVCEGRLMLAYQPLKSRNLKNFFRMVFHAQPQPTEDDVQFVMDEIHRLGKDM